MQLLDAKWPIKSSLDQGSLHSDEFLFRPAASDSTDKTRVVSAYAPDVGGLTPDTNWTNAPAAAEPYELHGRVPPIADGYSDLHALINEGLKKTLLVVEICATPTLNKRRHSLGPVASWLANPLWIYRVGYLLNGEDRNQRDPYERVISGEIVVDGDAVLIEHTQTFNVTDTLYIELLKPAYYHCRASGGTFGGQSGLSLETDEAVPQPDWVAAATMSVYWLRQLEQDPNSTRVAASLQRATARFTDLRRKFLHTPRRTFHPAPARFGPVAMGTGVQFSHRIIIP